MNRAEIITELKKYFNIHELVDEPVYSIFGERAWRFFSTDLLHSLLIIRKQLNKPMTINTWKWGGRFSQRGLRHNQSSMVRSKSRPYLSAHMMGKAVDFNVKGITPNEVRLWIVNHADLFPCKIRLERNLRGNPINWVHLDIVDEEKNPKIYLFDV